MPAPALMYDAESGAWSGWLPRNCLVRLQCWDPDREAWVPDRGGHALPPLPRAEALAALLEGLRDGLLMHTRYRLVVTRPRRKR